jgi:hypothetical protein
MEDNVTLIDQLGCDRMIVDSIDRVVKTRMAFEMLNVLDRAGRQIVYDVDFIATLNVSIAQMRSDETSTTCDEYSQTLAPYWRGVSLECGGLAPL